MWPNKRIFYFVVIRIGEELRAFWEDYDDFQWQEVIDI
jgi:hypothetical protein